MGNLYKNVAVLNQTANSDSFKIELPNGKKVLLSNCHLTNDDSMIPLSVKCFLGNCEFEEDKENHCMRGVLHQYLESGRYDLWIDEKE